MKHLIHTFLENNTETGEIVKFEIFTKQRALNIHEKVPEGTCQIIRSTLSPGEGSFKITHANFNTQPLFEANRPQPNTWYSDGPDRVSLEMIIEYLKKRK